MHPAPFEYRRAESYEHAAELLDAEGDEARVIAGGQSLVPMMHLRLVRPQFLVDVSGLDHGRGPAESDGELVIPAQTKQRAIERSPVIRRSAPLLAAAAAHTGNIRVRSSGTAGGNLAHGDPTSELSGALVALGAEIDVTGPDTTRSLAVDDLLMSDYTTSLGPAEVITALRVPSRPPRTGHAFAELTRRAGEFAVANVAAVVSLDEQGTCVGAAVACGGAGPRILNGTAPTTEILVGHSLTPDRVGEAARAIADMATPRDDHQASASYRTRILEVLARRALKDAAADAGEPGVG